MSKQTSDTIWGVILTVVGAVLLFYGAKLGLTFLLNHWLLVLIVLFLIAAFIVVKVVQPTGNNSK
jgi:Mn2+/Fe2+ NRAMP family transporter